MPLLGRRRRPDRGWVEGVAVIRESDRGHDSSGADPYPWDDVLDLVGSRTYRFTLEVTVAGREPYPVAGRFKVPKRAESTGLGSDGYLAVGLELPVRVDPADRGAVAIDWDCFLADPGRKQAVRGAIDARRVGHMRDELERNPALAAKLRANNRAAAQSWVEAVRAGSMSREELERELRLEVETGRMDPTWRAARSSTTRPSTTAGSRCWSRGGRPRSSSTRRTRAGSRSGELLVEVGTAAAALDVGAALLGLDPAALGGARRARLGARAPDLERRGEPAREPLERELAVAVLGARVLRGGRDAWAEPCTDACLLGVGEGP